MIGEKGCGRIWTLHLSIFSSNNSQNRLISASSATGCHTGISDGDAGGAEESGPIAEECWPVLLLKSEMDQISQVDTGHSGYTNEMRYTDTLSHWDCPKTSFVKEQNKHCHAPRTVYEHTHAMWNRVHHSIGNGCAPESHLEQPEVVLECPPVPSEV